MKCKTCKQEVLDETTLPTQEYQYLLDELREAKRDRDDTQRALETAREQRNEMCEKRDAAKGALNIAQQTLSDVRRALETARETLGTVVKQRDISEETVERLVKQRDEKCKERDDACRALKIVSNERDGFLIERDAARRLAQQRFEVIKKTKKDSENIRALKDGIMWVIRESETES